MMGWMSSASAISLGFHFHYCHRNTWLSDPEPSVIPTSSAQAAMLRHMDPMASDPTLTACKKKINHSVNQSGRGLQQNSACLNCRVSDVWLLARVGKAIWSCKMFTHFLSCKLSMLNRVRPQYPKPKTHQASFDADACSRAHAGLSNTRRKHPC